MKQDFMWLVGLSIFTSLEWLPYILERIHRVGLFEAMGYDKKIHQKVPTWAEHCKKAHHNAIENLVPFIPLVIVAHLISLDVLCAIQIFCVARVVHYFCYTLSIPIVRTLAFFAGVGAELYIAYQIFLQLS